MDDLASASAEIEAIASRVLAEEPPTEPPRGDGEEPAPESAAEPVRADGEGS